MAAGLQVFNDSGLVQIDGQFINLSFYTKGTEQSVRADYGVDRVYRATFYCPSFPAIFWKAPNGVHQTGLQVDGGGYYTLEWIGDGATYYAFSSAIQAPSSGGMEVYNGSGVRVFSSSEKLLKIVYSGITDTYGGLPWSSSYAVAANGWSRGVRILSPGGIDQLHLLFGLLITNEQGFTVQGVSALYGSMSGTDRVPPSGIFRHTVADVAGL